MTILSIIIIIIIKEPLSVGVLSQVVADKAGVENGGSLGHKQIALERGKDFQ